MKEIKTIVPKYNCDNVFNMDETDIFNMLKLNQTLAKMRLCAKKK